MIERFTEVSVRYELSKHDYAEFTPLRYELPRQKARKFTETFSLSGLNDLMERFEIV